jgi:hypothetical protein
MGELTTDSTPGGSAPAAAPTAASVAHAPATTRSDAPSSFSATGTGGRCDPRVRDWSGSSSPVTTCRRSSSSGTTWLASGVSILDFKYRAAEGSATWEQRFWRLFGALQAGDVLVVVSERALGQTSDEVARTLRTLRRHNLVIKVLTTVRRSWRMHEADRR